MISARKTARAVSAIEFGAEGRRRRSGRERLEQHLLTIEALSNGPVSAAESSVAGASRFMVA